MHQVQLVVKLQNGFRIKKGIGYFLLKTFIHPKVLQLFIVLEAEMKITTNTVLKYVVCILLKLAHLLKEKLPDSEINEYYIDMRAYGKGYEEFYNRIKNEGD